jgi:hypothetical protein
LLQFTVRECRSTERGEGTENAHDPVPVRVPRNGVLELREAGGDYRAEIQRVEPA